MPTILNIEKVKTIYYYVDTNDDMFPTYRTDGKGNWEHLMGESWEPVYHNNEDELEKQFKQWNVNK